MTLQSRHGAGVYRSKLVKPQFSSQVVPRAVFSTFADKLVNNVKVGLVVAPAGYGKSTLMSQSFDVLASKEVRCAWVSLDTDDNNPFRFISHLLAALYTLNSIESENDTDHLGADLKEIIDDLVEDAVVQMEKLDFAHALFVDDYHTINNPEVHAIMERLIHYSPGQTIFVLASRSEPGLGLKTLRMRGEVCQLSIQDLAFGLDEIEQFLNEAKQLGLREGLIEALASRTEGWIAGLQLVSLALTGRTDSEEFIKDFSGTDRDVTDYLGEAVLDQQPEDIKRFLLWTSLLERMNANLANFVLGIDSAQAVLEQVEGQNLFVIPLDRNREWYRYHHLFRDFLNVQLAREYPGIAVEIYQRALTWCLEQGEKREAIKYALRGEIYDQAMELIAGIAKDLLKISGDHWTMLQWVQQLPEDYVSKRPEIAVAYTWSLVFSRHYAEARVLLETLDSHCEQLAPESREQLRYDIQLNKCLLESAGDNAEPASRLLKEWLAEHLQADPRDLVTAYVLQAYSALSTFETDLGVAAADKGIAIGADHELGYLEAWPRACAGMLKMQRGDLEDATRHYMAGIELNDRTTSSHSYMGSLNRVLLAEACYERNDLEQAEELLKDRFEYIDNESVVDVAYASYSVLAKLQFLNADFDAGLGVIRLGRESAERARLPRLGVLLSALEIHTLLNAGKSKEAHKLAKACGFVESQASTVYLRPAIKEVQDFVRAELYLDQKLPKKALPLLEELADRTENSGRLRRLMEVLLLRCRVFHALQQPTVARDDLIRALEIGSEGGLYRTILDASPDILGSIPILLNENRKDLSAQIMKFLGEINEQLLVNNKGEKAVVEHADSSVLFESLTKRERQMLDRIQTGQTNKEISEELFISEQTVKWHLHQLYQKLGVKNRTSAIVRARNLSLI